MYAKKLKEQTEMKNNNGHKNMHKVIMKHVLILIGVAAIIGLLFLIRNQCRQLSEQKALKHSFSAVMEAHIARYFAG